MADQDFHPIPLPEPVFYPPFNITRISHLVLTVRDLEVSLRFWCGVIGLIVSDREGDTAWLRGAEEACHHSLVLREVRHDVPVCEVLGYRVLTEAELDKAHDWAMAEGLGAEWVERPYQSRTLRLSDPAGTPIELCAHMPVMPRHMDHGTASLALAKRLDHVQVLDPVINTTTAFYTALGFRISDAIVDDGKLGACFLWRKGSVSDLVLMEGDGPRLHHAAYFVRQPADILRACDRLGELGFDPMSTEEGPGRHGMDGAYYIYFRDPDGHRVELFDGHYQTIDAELEPKQFPPHIAAPPWGRPTLASWFDEGTPFAGVASAKAPRPRGAPTMEDYIRGRDAAPAGASASKPGD